MEKIVVIFSDNKFYTREKILSFEPLRKQFVDLEVLSDFQNKKIKITNYDVIIDCTDNHYIYNTMLEQKKGTKLKDINISYLLTPSKKIVTTCQKVSNYFSGEFNDSDFVRENVKKTFEEYNNIIEFAYSKVPSIKNFSKFNKGLGIGIDITDFIENKIGEKKYKLVYDYPDYKEANTEYITPVGISIIKDFLQIKELIR